MKLTPVMTEKSMASAADNRYTFWVDRKAGKHQIRQAVEKKFKVEVLKVRTMNIGRRKKALVTVKPGQKIEVWEEHYETE